MDHPVNNARPLWRRVIAAVLLSVVSLCGTSPAVDASGDTMIYDPGQLKPRDSVLAVRVGEPAPAFALPSLTGETISLAQYRGTHNVVISFVPAAWTPVCSDQWPGYNIVGDMFDDSNAALIGITVDNLPTLHAWTRQMGNLWFYVLSDFWPHGAAAAAYGVLRPEGVSERAIFIVDRQGVIRYIDVADINVRPNLEALMSELKKLEK